MENLTKLHWIKTALYLPSYDLTLSNAYCTIDNLHWSRNLNNQVNLTIKVYASYEAMLEGKEGFLMIKTIPFNNETIPLIESTRGIILSYLLSDPSFIGSTVVED